MNANLITVPYAARACSASRPGNLSPWNSEMVMQELGSGLKLVRASSGSIYNVAGNPATQPVDTPRFDTNPATLAPRGLLVEGGKTNTFLNSSAPVNQSVSLATGTYTLWMRGSGSVACAAGTATGTGFGTANASTNVTFVLTVAGTVAFSVSGSPSAVQCEGGSFATSYISTGAAAATRAADVLAMSDVTPLKASASEGSIIINCEALAGSITSGASLILELSDTTFNNRIFVNNNFGNIQIGFYSGGVDQGSLMFNSAMLGGVKRLGIGWDAAVGRYASLNGAPVVSAGAFTAPVGIKKLEIGNKSGGSSFYGWIRKVAYYPVRLPNNLLESLSA